jgi:hypothetical protein
LTEDNEPVDRQPKDTAADKDKDNTVFGLLMSVLPQKSEPFAQPAPPETSMTYLAAVRTGLQGSLFCKKNQQPPPFPRIPNLKIPRQKKYDFPSIS